MDTDIPKEESCSGTIKPARHASEWGCAFSAPETVGQDGVSLDPLHRCPDRIQPGVGSPCGTG